MKVKFIDLGRLNSYYEKEILKSIKKVIQSGQYILGEEVNKFENKFAEYINTKYAIGVNSGTDALFLSLKALNIGKGDEVITVPNSFISTVSSIVTAGAKPVLVDVCEDLNINVDLIEEKITNKTKAIIPVHLTGKPAEMDRIMKIAKEHNLYIIEDAAQAIGAIYKNKKVGSFGITGCFSLHPLKNLSVCGDGGIIVSSDRNIIQKIKILRNIGLKYRDHVEMWGYNSRLDTLQAAIGLIKLKYIENIIKRKREIAKIYNENLKEICDVPLELPYERQVYQNYIIKVEERDRLMKFLFKKI